MYNLKDYYFEDEKPLLTEAYLFDPILEILKNRKDIKILDVGCGNGSIANALIKMGYDVYGVDASHVGIDLANKVNNNRFFLCDFEKMKLPSEMPIQKFDLIISTEVIEHLYSPHAFMKFCRMCLHPNGEILLSTPYHGYLKNLLLSLTNKLDDHFTVHWEGGHIKFWSKRTLKILLEMNGFNPTAFYGCGRFSYFWKSMIMTGKLN
jgi:2-polyprenyl-3-methyl-5-hydroxy-6-metoxy-1,4-benzoquinol methylase